jgi:hypothetical protein
MRAHRSAARGGASRMRTAPPGSAAIRPAEQWPIEAAKPSERGAPGQRPASRAAAVKAREVLPPKLDASAL